MVIKIWWGLNCWWMYLTFTRGFLMVCWEFSNFWTIFDNFLWSLAWSFSLSFLEAFWEFFCTFWSFFEILSIFEAFLDYFDASIGIFLKNDWFFLFTDDFWKAYCVFLNILKNLNACCDFLSIKSKNCCFFIDCWVFSLIFWI